MNSSFDDWYVDTHCGIYIKHRDIVKEAFEGGASSRQGEVDELNFQLAEMKSRLNEAYTDGQSSMYKTKQTEVNELQSEVKGYKSVYGKLELERDELQKRIDESLVKIFEWCNQTYRDDAHQLIGELEDILKGNTNE